MKKILLAFLAGLIPALAITNKTYAQSSDIVASAKPAKNFITMSNTDGIEKNNTLKGEAVNAKALKNFKKSYKANDEQWYKIKDGVSARFTSDGISNIVCYNKKGRWTSSMKQYTEDKLAPDVRKMVKQVYYDYKITYVREIETPDHQLQPTYIIYISRDKDFKLIRINDWDMGIYEEGRI